MNFKSGLYIVSTPIGNPDDITLRAIETLKNSDMIFCKNIKVTKKLLAKHHITTNLEIYNEKSSDKARKRIQKIIESDKVVSLVCSAGTPLISDPGRELVRLLKQSGYHVDIVPGVSSPVSALTLSGLPSDRFIFGGFLPKTVTSKEKTFLRYKDIDATMIFFDSPKRILKSLELAFKVLGNRRANISRDLTKSLQESKTARLSNLIVHYSLHPPVGEIVLLISKHEIYHIPVKVLTTDIENLINSGASPKEVSNSVFHKYHSFFSKSMISKIYNSIKAQKFKM